MAVTTHRGIPYPGDPSTEAPKICEEFEKLVKFFDNDAETKEGTAAERAAWETSGKKQVRGRIFFVSTAGSEYGLWWDNGTTWIQVVSLNTVPSSAKSIIATEQSRENTAYGTLATPDEVTVVLPENGLIVVAYQAVWENTIASAGRAALFIGSQQLKLSVRGNPEVQAAPGGTGTEQNDLVTGAAGLFSSKVSEPTSSVVTTGQVLGAGTFGAETFRTAIGAGGPEAAEKFVAGPCYVYAAAGTYKVSVQFKASSGQITVKNRKLWAWVVA